VEDVVEQAQVWFDLLLQDFIHQAVIEIQARPGLPAGAIGRMRGPGGRETEAFRQVLSSKRHLLCNDGSGHGDVARFAVAILPECAQGIPDGRALPIFIPGAFH